MLVPALNRPLLANTEDAASRRSFLQLCGAAAASAIMAPAAVLAQTPPSKGSSQKQVKDAALRSMPLEGLPAEARRRLAPVLENPTLYRRLPVRSIPCDSDLYTLLVYHPDLMVNIWQVLGISQVSLVETEPNLFAGSDGEGTNCVVESIVRSPGVQLLYAEGVYRGGLLKSPSTGKTVVFIRYELNPDSAGGQRITTQVDLFVQVDNGALDFFAKTVKPLIDKHADANLDETLLFIARLNRTSESNPEGLEKLARKLDRVRPPVLEQFRRVNYSIAERSAQRRAMYTAER